MRASRKILFFAFCLALCLTLIEAYARLRVTATPARQALARYLPDGKPHAVFLGSSLTDAGIRVGLLDSLSAESGPGFRSFNLALAGLSGSANYYLLFKNFIRPRARPRFLVVEAPGVPYFPPAAPFRLEGSGLRVETFRSELMDYRDFRYLAEGFPGIAASLSFVLHKYWFGYHHRLEIQARIRERLVPAGDGPLVIGPYQMAGNAFDRFAQGARSDLHRMEAAADGMEAMRRRTAHLLDLAELTRAEGIRLVVLKPPCPPMDEVTGKVPTYRIYDSGFRALCDSLGVAYLDLSMGKSCGPYSFADGIHLDEAGARIFTACVARALEMPAQPVISPGPAVP